MTYIKLENGQEFTWHIGEVLPITEKQRFEVQSIQMDGQEWFGVYLPEDRQKERVSKIEGYAATAYARDMGKKYGWKSEVPQIHLAAWNARYPKAMEGYDVRTYDLTENNINHFSKVCIDAGWSYMVTHYSSGDVCFWAGNSNGTKMTQR